MTDTQTQTVTELLAPPNLYRNQHNPSKLPSYRITDRTARTTVLAAQSAAISVQLPDFSVDGKPTSSLQNASAMNPPAINTADKPTSMSSSLSSEVFSPKIPPIRSFRKPRTSTSEMVHGAAQRLAMEEDDNTLKTPDSNTGALSDDSDLFLNIAKEEANISRNNSQRLPNDPLCHLQRHHTNLFSPHGVEAPTRTRDLDHALLMSKEWKEC
ncbi:hypothetical protein DH86_00000611 [Scytalidium sp. 3C]|nr:hypothetical protein DH86_00000611 [Scytalidium sp. 3C]